MKLLIAAVGKLKAGPERDLYERYAERTAAAGRSMGLGPLDLRSCRIARRTRTDPDRRRSRPAPRAHRW